jgi:hypothetical protein
MSKMKAPPSGVVADLAARPGEFERWSTKAIAAVRERLARADYNFGAKPARNFGAKPARQTQQTRIRDLLPIAFPPDGRPPSDLSLKAIKAALKPVFEKNGLKEPSTDSIARALGLRSS